MIAASLGMAAVTISLGRWQLRRLAGRKASNAVFLAAQAESPIHLPQDLSPGIAIDSGRRIVARGTFDVARQLLLRGRVQNDAPGLEVVTPLVLQGDSTVLWVVRGFVGSPDAATPPDSIPAPGSGEVTVTGVAFAIPRAADSGRPLVHNGVSTWQRLDQRVTHARATGSLDVDLLLAGDTTGPGKLATIPLPEISNGPHLSYAIQWFGMAFAVLLFPVIILWRERRAATTAP
ncbi:MAG TPA: SURF1 family protein [Gemmatimonadales bacterium]|jgi:cytochrome oxidase assembly protein ShyY1